MYDFKIDKCESFKTYKMFYDVYFSESDFSLPDFHALMLTNGAVPLNILDQFVDEWIKQRKTSAASVTKPVSFVCVVIIIINAMM